MLNYIKADLSRIFKRAPRIVLLLISFAVFCLAIFIYVSVTKVLADPAFEELGLGIVNPTSHVYGAIVQIAGYAMGLFGLFELIYVFSDDFRAKTAQIAIGVGVGRFKVILSKLIDLLVLLVVDMIVLLGLSFLMSMLLGATMSMPQLLDLGKQMVVGMVLSNLAYSALLFILLFPTQSMTLGILGFLALNFHIVSGIVSLSNHVSALEKLNLSRYTLTTFLGKIGDMAEGAALDIVPFLAVAAYIAVSLLITHLLYRNKELDF